MGYFTRLLLAALVLVACSCFGQSAWAQSLSQNPIEANVPAEAEFDALLTRDLRAYFSTRATSVSYELLRQAPTQSGIAYPKFYAWVRLFNGAKVVDEGAVRVAAIERVRFEITHYFSKAAIVQNPSAIEQVFPSALLPDIRNRATIEQRRWRLTIVGGDRER
jgi:hypothetical protein